MEAKKRHLFNFKTSANAISQLIATKNIEIFEKYKVKKVIYGHLHGMTEDKLASELNGNIEYIMTSCDYLDFCPKKIL